MAGLRTGRSPEPVARPARRPRRVGAPRRTVLVGAVALLVGVAVGVGGTWLMTRPSDRPVSVASYDLAQNELGATEITVNVTTGRDAAFTVVLVADKPDRVEITVRERVNRGPSLLVIGFYQFSWLLREPLGSRPVVDTSTGTEVERAKRPATP